MANVDYGFFDCNALLSNIIAPAMFHSLTKSLTLVSGSKYSLTASWLRFLYYLLIQDSWTLKMERIGCSETSIRNYQ